MSQDLLNTFFKYFLWMYIISHIIGLIFLLTFFIICICLITIPNPYIDKLATSDPLFASLKNLQNKFTTPTTHSRTRYTSHPLPKSTTNSHPFSNKQNTQTKYQSHVKRY